MDRTTCRSARPTLVVALATLVLLASLIVGPLAPAFAGSAVVDSGSCTGSASWRLSVTRHGGSLAVKFKITDSPARHRWTVFMDNAGWGFYSGSRRANGAGTLVVGRSTNDRAGADRITVAATDRATGETCSGQVRI